MNASFPKEEDDGSNLPLLKRGSTIINTASRDAYEGNKNVIDYCDFLYEPMILLHNVV
jgi:hypothetical protein